jgi:hypothetical protein
MLDVTHETGDIMASSTIEHDDATPPTVKKGHGTASLGPSDSSDSGSDIQGGPGLNRDDGLMQPTGTTSDPDVDGARTTAGPDIGDANLDSDSDRHGTGERAAAGRDSTLPVDTLLRENDDNVVDGASIGDEVDSDVPTADELVGSGAEQEDLDAGAGANVPPSRSYRPAQAGQDARTPSGDEHGYARARGKPARADDDTPLFDRSGRDEDISRDRR